MSSAICFNLDQSEILSSGNGLTFISDIFSETGLLLLGKLQTNDHAMV